VLRTDIRELISLEDVMELKLGPNGGLVYCMEYPFFRSRILFDMFCNVNVFSMSVYRETTDVVAYIALVQQFMVLTICNNLCEVVKV
jgi:hypothetical protein